MKNWKSVLMILISLCPISEASAQFNSYTLMRRGEVSLYDSSVNIEISEYRSIRRKVLTYDTLRQRMQSERIAFDAFVRETQVRNAMTDDVIKAKSETIAAKDVTISELRDVITGYQKATKKLQISPIPILDATAKVGGGIIIGVITGLIIHSLTD